MRRCAVLLPLLLALPTLSPTPQDPAVAKVGKPAPAFRVNDHTGKAVRFGGKSKTWTVLAFYPKAGTPG